MGLRSLRMLALSACLLIPSEAVLAASIGLSGSVRASELSDTLMLTVPRRIAIWAYDAVDDGTATATSIEGFPSLAGIAPSSLRLRFGDLERLSTTYSPVGCTPLPHDPSTNCDTASNHYGENDGSPAYFDISLSGVGTILSGDFRSLTTTTVTDPDSLDFLAGSAEGRIRFHDGLAPYLDDVLSLTRGSGLARLAIPQYDSVCIFGSSGCSYEATAVLTFVPEPSTAVLVAGGLCLLSMGRSMGRSVGRSDRERASQDPGPRSGSCLRAHRVARAQRGCQAPGSSRIEAGVKRSRSNFQPSAVRTKRSS